MNWIESTGWWSPLLMVGVFVAGSLLTVWRLESMSAGGLEGTVLGTLITPYITGMGNLFFAFLIARQKSGSATEVLTNCLVNNVTNMTLVLGLPAVIWSMDLFATKSDGKKSKAKAPANTHEVNRLSLLLTLTAVLFFTGTTWALGADGKISFMDGVVLVGLFLFWQSFHVFEVLKSNARQNKSFNWMMAMDLALLAVGGYFVYASTKWLVEWAPHAGNGFIANHIGWLSGWIDVLPNALLAIYYGWTKRPEIVYTSQVGDGHICIPLCIGIFALFRTIHVPSFFTPGVIVLIGATLLHFFFIAAMGRLPRLVGLVLVAAYGYFIYTGLI
ncbi:MAG TPA: sodium:calcium symporter, partial [Verrucomicrobiae bacterium]|nr:sodium:calcium symporter [Verrucomicrobiae bacterium]